jgi:hypothetical protein
MLHARTLSIALLAIAAMGVAGCGGDDSGGGGDDESQIRDVVSNYAVAIADKDGDTACGFLTESARKAVESAGEALDANGCAEVMEKATAEASDDERDQLKDIEVTSVKIDGDRATVQVKAAGETGDPSTLVKEDGEWRIAANEGGTATAESPTVSTPSAATVTSP